jgi:hypothetical protein
MLARGTVTHFAFDISMRARRPLCMSLVMACLAVGRPAELRRWIARHLDNGITAVIAELVIGGIENEFSCDEREDQE